VEDKAKLAIQSLAITNQRLSALQSNELNPRLHTKAQIRQIAASIEMYCGPVLRQPAELIQAANDRPAVAV
jgi:hypothetical protein